MSIDFERRQREWFNRAGDYVASARTLVNSSGPTAPIALLAWQGAENDLKSISEGHSIPNTHDLGVIMDHLRSNNLLTPDDITQLSANARVLTGSATYNDTRYPEKNLTYWSSLPSGAIVNVVEAAEQIHRFTETKIAQQRQH